MIRDWGFELEIGFGLGIEIWDWGLGLGIEFGKWGLGFGIGN